MTDSALLKALYGQDYSYTPNEFFMGSLASGLATSLPKVVDPYGDRGTNLATVLGGSLLAGLFGYQAKKEAEQKNAEMLPVMMDLIQAKDTDTIAELLKTSPYGQRLAPIGISRMSALEDSQQRSAQAVQAENRYRNRFQWTQDVQNMDKMAQQYGFVDAQQMAERDPASYNAVFKENVSKSIPVEQVDTQSMMEMPQEQSVTETPTKFDVSTETAKPNIPEKRATGEFTAFADEDIAIQLDRLPTTDKTTGRPYTLKEQQNRQKKLEDTYSRNAALLNEAKNRTKKITEDWTDINQKYLTGKSFVNKPDAVSSDALIFVVKKVFDPDSTITIPEFLLTKQAQSVVDEIKGKIAKGAFGLSDLSPKTRSLLFETVVEVRNLAGRKYNELMQSEVDVLLNSNRIKSPESFYSAPLFVQRKDAEMIRQFMNAMESTEDPTEKQIFRDGISEKVGTKRWTPELILRYMEE